MRWIRLASVPTLAYVSLVRTPFFSELCLNEICGFARVSRGFYRISHNSFGAVIRIDTVSSIVAQSAHFLCMSNPYPNAEEIVNSLFWQSAQESERSGSHYDGSNAISSQIARHQELMRVPVFSTEVQLHLQSSQQ